MIIFSTFLKRCPGMGGNYSILEWVLGDMLGWSQEDKQLLFEGVSTSRLLKPDLPPASEARREDPYWHWMIPSHSKSRGWLSQEQISYLYQRLLSEKGTIQTFDHSRFGDHRGVIKIDVPDGQLDYLRRLQAAFGRALVMLEVAQQAETELYMTISYT